MAVISSTFYAICSIFILLYPRDINVFPFLFNVRCYARDCRVVILTVGAILVGELVGEVNFFIVSLPFRLWTFQNRLQPILHGKIFTIQPFHFLQELMILKIYFLASSAECRLGSIFRNLQIILIQ